MSLDEQQGDQELPDDGKVCPIATGIEEAVYQVKQFNIVMDVLGGSSEELESTIRGLVGVKRGKEVLLKMQKVVLSESLNIARFFKVLT